MFVSVQQYGTPPMSVYQGGGIFTSRVIPRKKDAAPALRKLNQQVLSALGMVDGVAHTEFIQAHDDSEFYFLESAARVGGAHLADLIEQATGVNLWCEWGRLIVANLHDKPYTVPDSEANYAGLLMTLAKQEFPDLSAYDDSEVVWRADKPYHAGLIVASPSYERVEELLAHYTERFAADFSTSAPPMGPQRT